MQLIAGLGGAPLLRRGEGWRPLRRDQLVARLLPFAAAAVLGALAPLGAPGSGVGRPAVVVAAACVGLLAAASLLLPWDRLPASLSLLPITGYLATVVLLRAGTSGSTLVYEPLLTLPVFWLALYHPGAHLAAGIAAVAAIVVVSLAVQGVSPGQWPAQVFWPIAAATLGLTVHRFVARVRGQQYELELMARTDPLTGAGNRRAWQEQLDRHLALAARLDYRLTVALLDLDHFKQWNDEHGHQAGDAMLARLVLRWASQLREVDLLARLGGDEFGVLLPGSDPAETDAAVERLRAVVPAPLSCSAGVTTWDRGEDGHQLVARADRALYAAKRAGGDRIVVLAPREAPVGGRA